MFNIKAKLTTIKIQKAEEIKSNIWAAVLSYFVSLHLQNGLRIITANVGSNKRWQI